MNLKAIGNADMATVARWLREGFSWWIAELTELLPRNWQQHVMRSTPCVVELRDGKVVARAQTTDGALPRTAVLVLPSQAVLTRRLELPALSAADTRRMVALDVDRLAPFRPDCIVFDIDIERHDDEAGGQQVLLGVLPRGALEEAIARAREQRVEPSAVSIDAEGALRFDFLRANRQSGQAPATARRAGMWWGGVAALAVANVLIFTYQDEANLDNLREAVESQQATVAVASRLRHKVDQEAARRADVLDRARATPLRALAAITTALPDSVWADRIEWNGKTVHIAGYQHGPVPILRALERSAALKGAHTLTGPPATQAGVVSFDIAANLQPEARR